MYKRDSIPHFPSWLPQFLVVAVMGILLLFIYYSYSLAERMVERYTPLIDATMEMKLEATTAHLWFEEILSDDREESLEEVFRSLAQADWYIEAMLEGGVNEEGHFIPLKDKLLREHISHVRTNLKEFVRLVEERWKHRQEAGPGSEYDGHFDRVFAEFIEEADLVETRLQYLTIEAMGEFRRIQIALLVLAFVTSLSFLSLLISFNRRRQQQIVALDNANRELRSEIALRKQAEEVLQRQASTDALTGLLNRRHMNQLLHDEHNRSQRYQTTFSVMMFDIDHFKSINDGYGHEIGDEVLKQVATRISSVLRQSDRFARWGGEEFLILLPGTDMEGASELAERCRKALTAESFEVVGTVSASFGIGLYERDESMRELLHRIDEALYRAKNGGRNRVEAA